MPDNAKQFTYDVFISHSSQDEQWARKLKADLVTRGFPNVFLDGDGLNVGDDWEDELIRKLDASRHLVIIWSNAAKNSDWVNRERGRFDARFETRAEMLTRNERLLVLLMDTDMPSFASIQQVRQLKQSGVYAAGPGNVDAGLWNDLANSLTNALNVKDPRVPVPVVVLAMDSVGAQKLDLDAEPAVGPKLSAVLTDLSLAPPQFRALYNARRVGWRPLGSPDNVETILIKMSAEINDRLVQRGQQQFRWEALGDAFWSDDLTAMQLEASRMSDAPVSVVVVDPLSLYDQKVHYRLFNVLGKALNMRQVIFMVLPPFAMPPLYQGFRNLIRIAATPVFDQFYEPDLDLRIPRAECSLHISDEQDLKRALLSSVGRQLFKPVDGQVSPMLVTRGM